MNTKLLLSTLAISVLSISACTKPADKVVTKEEPARPVRYITIAPGSVGELVYLPAELRPRYEQRYGFRVPGKIAKRFVDVGQKVSVGQTLATLDPADVLPAINAQRAQVDVARADLVLQQNQLKRQQGLRDKEYISAAALETQTTAVQAATARLAASQSQLANVQNGLTFQTLKAEKAGVVIAVDAEAGSVVAAGQAVIRVAQAGEQELVVNVPERSVALMRKARSFNASFDASPGKIYTASLRELSPIADPASRTYAARLHLNESDDALRLGMSASVQLDLGAAQAIVVPNTALYTRDNITRVWLLDKANQTVKPTDIKTGESTADGVVVLSGLKAGDLVVTAGSNLLLAGQKVKIVAEAKP